MNLQLPYSLQEPSRSVALAPLDLISRRSDHSLNDSDTMTEPSGFFVPDDLWDVFLGFDFWVPAHTIFPLLIAAATGSRAIGLLSAYAWETLTVILAAFDYNVGYTGAMEGLVQDPVMGVVGVALAPVASEGIRGRPSWNLAMLVGILSGTLLLHASAMGKYYWGWWVALGGLYPFMWFYVRDSCESLVQRNDGPMDVIRIYGLLCLVNLITFMLGGSTFVWTLWLVVLPEVSLMLVKRVRRWSSVR